MALELAQVVAQSVQAVGALGEMEGCEDRLVDLLGRPAADVSSALQQDFEQADDPGFVDFDAGIAHGADGDRQGDPLQQWEVDMNVEPLRLEAGEAVGDGLEGLAHRIEMVEALAQAEVGEVVGTQFVAQEGRELLVLLEEGVFEVGAVDMMPVFDAVDHAGKLAAVAAGQTGAEDHRHLVGGKPPQAVFATALKQPVDREVAREDEVAAVLDLSDGIEARQVDRFALFGREFRPQDQGPIVEPFADDVRAQPVGGRLQRGNIVHRQEGIVVLAEADLRTGKFLFDEAVAVEVIGGLERKERGDAYHHRSEHFIADVEVIMSEAAALMREKAVVRVGGGIFRHGDAEGRSLLHALEDEVDAVAIGPRHAAKPGQHMVLLAHALLGPLNRKAMIAGIGLDPVLAVTGAPAQHLFVNRRDADHPAEEVHHLLGPRQASEVAVNDNAVEAGIDKDQEIAEQFVKQLHWQAPQCPGKIDQATAAPASAGSRARAFVLPMRSATSSAAPPLSTMGASSRSVNSRYSPPKPATPGSSTATIIWRSGSPARATPNHSTSRKPTLPLQSTGRGATAWKAKPSSTPIATPAAQQPCSAIQPTSSRELKISNMFG